MENQKNSNKKTPIKNNKKPFVSTEFKKDLKSAPSDFKKKSVKGSVFKKNLLKKPQIKNKELEKNIKELEELKKSYRYLQAEFANFKRVAQKEKEQTMKYSTFNFLQDVILNFLNDFNRAMEKNWESKDFESFKKGVEMLHSKFVKILKQHHVEEIVPKGLLFDPTLHEVVSMEENKEHPDDTILHICRKGYQLHDRLVQPAQVIVSKNAQSTDSQKSEQ